MKNVKFIAGKLMLPLLALVICVCFYSCNEKPVEPPPPPVVEPDTVSRYIWTIYSGMSRGFNVYASDTNYVHIVRTPRLYYWNGTGFGINSLNDYNFNVYNVYGYGKDVIFVSGYKTINGKDLPIIKKVDHGIITEIVLDTVENLMYDQLIIGPDEAWFASFLKNDIYHYKNGVIKKYRSYHNDSLMTGVFYKNANNEIYLFQRQPDIINPKSLNKEQKRQDMLERKSYGPGTMYSFKFENDKFNLLSSQCYGADNPDCFTILIFQCGNDALMVSNIDKISVFNGYNWQRHSYLDSSDMSPQRIGGVSKDSLVIFTINYGYLFTYNGTKWRIENNSPWLMHPPSLGHSNVEAKFGNIYFFEYSPLSMDPGHFYVGRPNKQILKK